MMLGKDVLLNMTIVTNEELFLDAVSLMLPLVFLEVVLFQDDLAMPVMLLLSPDVVLMSHLVHHMVLVL